MEELYLVDFYKEGNVVQFIFGNRKQADESWGDDWDDRPYEHNAGTVYSEYVDKVIECAFPLQVVVAEPCDGYLNSTWSKQDMKKRIVPAVVTYEMTFDEYRWEYECDSYAEVIGCDSAIKFYFGDSLEEVEAKIAKCKGIVFNI